MNEYKFTYHYPEGSDEVDHVIERTEKAARRVLLKRCGDVEIVSSELVRDDAIATKEQERETLEKIKAMVAELGPQSYLATAFEGTFEDAETNIENDFAFSMKARVESAEDKLREMGSAYNALKRDAARLQEQLKAAQEQIEVLKKRQLFEQLRRDLVEMLTAEAQASRARMAEAADKMAMCAESAACVLFKDSVALYRAEKARAEAMEQRAAELAAMEPETK